MLSVKVNEVLKGSKCEQKGIVAGDELQKINGNEICDVLDYDFYMADGNVTLSFKCQDGKYRLVKADANNCGLKFETYLMAKQQKCKNKCVFCFIDQLPKGMRPSLYFKDDDSRLSFLFGNYITLTNISEHEVERIIKMHISPINISVHTMNPELRVKMMNNKNAGKCLDIIKRLAEADIKINAQLVLCPEINDGDELRFSIEELSKFFPAVQSVACVPVGLTKFREGLFPLKPYTKESASEVVDIINEYADKFRVEYGAGIVYPSDEFFIKAEREIPNADYYDGYPQYDNGVGLIRSFYDEVVDALEYEKYVNVSNKKVTLATGVDFYLYLCELAEKIMEKYNIQIQVKKIVNNFFGENITVTGLLTGQDIYEQLKDTQIGECLILSNSTISDYTNHTEHKNKFLDDMTVEELQQKLNTKIILTNNQGEGLLEDILGVR